MALGHRVFERLAPDPDRLSALAGRRPDLSLFTDYVRYVVERATAEPEIMLALLELRLEATRRPGLGVLLGDVLRRGYLADLAFSRDAGFPAGPLDVALMHFAVDGLLLDLLTPSIGAGHAPEEVVTVLVDRLLGSTGVNR